MDGIPFEHDAGLGRVSASQDGWGGGVGAEGGVDVLLQAGEFLLGDEFGVLVPCDIDVDDRAGVDVGGKQDGWEFDLKRSNKVSWAWKPYLRGGHCGR